MPDAEVVARPKRRRFAAEYRLQILEEADRCTQPGDPGRLLRRERLCSSHQSAWRKARKEGALKGLSPKNRGAKAKPRNPLEPKVTELEATVAKLEKELHQARMIMDVQEKSCRAVGLQLRRREALLKAAETLSKQVGVVAACRALGVSRATLYRRREAVTGTQQPRPTPARALKLAEREHVLDTLASLRRSIASGSRRHAAG
ncbi:MAG: hypothetical protein ACIAQ0_13075 [Phycisphaerales bacterium JB058]